METHELLLAAISTSNKTIRGNLVRLAQAQSLRRIQAVT